MEPRQFEKSAESRGEVQAPPPRPQERKRRFQIVKLEERIAPGGGGNGKHSEFTVCNYSKHGRCY
jgi:hypothetical protein